MTHIYLLLKSFILAVLLTAVSLESTQAFSVIPKSPVASSSFVPSESYKLKNGINGVVTRQPIAFASISRGGTDSFIAELKAEFPEFDGWKFVAATDDLKGSFSVSAYYVFVNGTDVSGCGGGFAFDYIPRESDPVSAGKTELHWIQRIVSNHKRGSDHGTAENRIVFWSSGSKKKQPDVPFFDVVPKTGKRPPKSASSSVPPHFEYDAGKNDPENDHQWSTEVYLSSVNKNNPKTVTVYNGVSWGWENKNITETAPAASNLLKVQP